MSTSKASLCRYRYSALDLLTGIELAGQQPQQRFYCREHLATDVQGAASQSVFQQGHQLLALQSRDSGGVNNRLLATDPQRSVLQVTDRGGSVQQVYSPYGHRRIESGAGSLLGYNGEAVDPLTGHYLLGNGHRMFNPALMRFNRPDELSPFSRGGLNPYAYCVGDPVNFSDPTGQFAEIGRLITSILGLSNTGLGMTRAIPSFNLAKDALGLGALRKLPARQGFAATSTVVASGLILTTGVAGVASAVVLFVENPEAAKILGYVALGLTTLAVASRVGTYWAVRKPGTEAALVSFVKNKGQVSIATPHASPRPSVSFEPSAPPLTPGLGPTEFWSTANNIRRRSI
ncbi:RHS repeat-associated core domain-containing protein [Pseudomonas sp. GB2N2]